MKINHNIAALNAFNKLNQNQNAISKSLEKLSSGKRINRAADDAAGMAIAQKMDTQVRGLDVASRNTLDGISVIQTAEGAMNEVHSMLQRARELSIQAANGTLTNDDRLAIQDEINQLKTEINRISDATEFNTRKLLNGDIDMRSSSNDSKLATLKYVSDVVDSGMYKVKITQPAKQAYVSGNTFATTTGAGSVCFAKDGAGAVTSLPVPGVIYINNEKVTIETGDTLTSGFAKLKDLCYKVGVSLYSSDNPPKPGSGKLTFVNDEYGTSHKITISGDKNTLGAFGLVACDSEKPAASVPTMTIYKGQDVAIDGSKLSTSFGFSAGTTAFCDGDTISIKNSGDFEIRLQGLSTKYNISGGVITSTTAVAATAASPASVGIEILPTGPLNLHIGANANQILAVRVGSMDTVAMGIDKLNVYTETNAEHAISTLDDAIRYVSRFRSKLGAYQNRLEHTSANLDSAEENMTASLSRIEDTDMAKEMAEYTKDNILIQAGTSMLAQANQLPQGMLKLLQ